MPYQALLPVYDVSRDAYQRHRLRFPTNDALA